MTDSALYRPCVGLALFNAQGHVFVGQRIDTPEAWQMPQGGVDAGESIEDAALRELQEEIGTASANIVHILEPKIRYDLPPDLQKKLWKGRYKGQEQTWIALRFTGQDSDINLTAHHPPEFSAWQWVPLERTLDLIVPFKKEAYKQVIGLLKKAML